MKEVSFVELTENCTEETKKLILEAVYRYQAPYVVRFVNQCMDSSHCGEATFLPVGGPENTYKSLAEVEGKWLNDLPSQRQYPQDYWKVLPEMTWREGRKP